MKRVTLTTIIFIFVELLLMFSVWFTEIWFDSDKFIFFKIVLTLIVFVDIVKDIIALSTGVNESKEQTGLYIWKDRKRIIFGLPWSFTRYRLTKEKLIVDKGFFSRHESEVRLYRVMDLCVERSFGQRIFNMGTVTVHSSDKSDSTLVLKNIKRATEIKELISKWVEHERVSKRVSGREIMAGSEHDDELETEDDLC